MALAEMCKARIAVHKSVADELAARLQALGCCEFICGDGDKEHGAAMFRLREKRRHTDELIGDAKFVQRLLEPYESKKEGSFAKMLGEVPTLTLSQLSAQVNEKKFIDFTTNIRDVEKRLTETRAELSRLKGLLAQVAVFESIKYPLELFTAGTQMISGFIYTMPKIGAHAMAAKLTEEFGFFSSSDIPDTAYEGVANTTTVAVGAQWITSSDEDEELVYQITKALWNDNTRTLLDVGHAKGASINKETALDGIGIPLHAGAERFYREAGLLQ